MKQLNFFLISLLMINVATAANIKMIDDLNFEINPEKLKNGRIEMAIKFFPVEEFRGTDFSSLDIEDLSSNNEAEMGFIKGAFIVDRPITDFNQQFFLNKKSIDTIFDAKSVTSLSDKKVRVKVSEMGIPMSFDLMLDYKDDNIMTSDRFDHYIDAAIELDETLPEAAKYQLLTQSNFTRIFNRSISINMLIPYGTQTLFVSYSIVSARKNELKKINSIPFVNIYKILSNQLKDCLKRTHMVMEEK